MTQDDHIARTIATYDVIASQYRVTATPELREWEESSMRLFADFLEGSRVLVPGCGDGRDSRYLQSLGLDVHSLDLSDGMLAEARKLDSVGRYQKLDLRDIGSLDGRFDGVFASGCLYHLREGEFKVFVTDVYGILEPSGVFYLNMKLGSGEEFRSVPGEAYPGGERARRLLRGERYYKYYSRDELISHMPELQILYERPIRYAEKAVEFWMGKA